MARQVSAEAVFEALSRVKYPGFSADIVALGLVEEVTPKPDGGFSILVRQASERDETMRHLADDIHQALTHGLGVKRCRASRARWKLRAGEKTGRVRLEGTKYIVAVASGKGGVGKSTVAANLACSARATGAERRAARCGHLRAVGADDVRYRRRTTQVRWRAEFLSDRKYGIKLISIGFFFLGERAPVIWRGPMSDGRGAAVPEGHVVGHAGFSHRRSAPGTGDAQLTLAQQVSLDGVVIVTTPQDVALLDARSARCGCSGRCIARCSAWSRT